MKTLNPSLVVNRVMIAKGGSAAYDQHFHLGLNVIRGNNSSGKSSIIELIFYGLGGELSRWKKEQGSCEYVMIEVTINQDVITVKREIDPTKTRLPIAIFWGPFDKAAASAADGWNLYGQTRTDTKESFSQVLFRTLSFPEMKAADNNVTMHQLLRLLYVDQMTPPDSIFRQEQFDSPIIREAIGDLMCGVFEEQVLEHELELREKNREFDKIQSQVQSIYSILGKADQDFRVDTLKVDLGNAQVERTSLYEKLKQSRDLQVVSMEQASTTKQQHELKTLQDQIASNAEDFIKMQDDQQRLAMQTQDATVFIDTLKSRLKALDQSKTTQDVLGDMAFVYCPSCLQPIEPSPTDHCHVCKRSTPDDKKSQGALLRMKQEIALQIKESEFLLKEDMGALQSTNRSIASLSVSRKSLVEKFESLMATVRLNRDQEIDNLYERIGYLNGKIDELNNLLKLAETLDLLSQTKASLNSRISELKDKISQGRALQEKRRKKAAESVSRKTIELLHRDLPREEAFKNAKEFEYSFYKGTLSVDGQNQFSASSMIYLKNVFHFSLFWSSLELDFFKWPRFILLDNMEDKGMEPPRSHNFQNLIAKVSSDSKVAHQIIISTAMVSPELEKSGLTVGEFYTETNKTLKV